MEDFHDKHKEENTGQKSMRRSITQHKIKSFSIQKRLLSLFGIIVVPVILIGIGGQWMLNRSMTDEILTSVSLRIQDSATLMDEKIKETNDRAATLLYNSRAMRVASPLDPMSNYDRSVNVNFLRDYLLSIKVSNSFINNVRLYFPRMKICYNTEGAYDYTSGHNFGSQMTITEEMLTQLLSFGSAPGKLHIYDGKYSFLQYSSLANPDIIVETIYTPTELRKYMKETLLYEGAYYYFIPDETAFPTGQVSDSFFVSQVSAVTNSADNLLNEAVLSLSSEKEGLLYLRWNGQRYYVFRHRLSNADATYLQVIPASLLLMNLSAATRYTIIFTVTVIFCVALIVIFSIRILRKPIEGLGAAFAQIENHQFDTRVGEPTVSDFTYLYNSFNHMAQRLDTLIQKELKYDLLLQKSQLKQLQAQINPHFLYNSFFMLNQMIARGQEDSAKELTKNLGTYFKYITRNSQDDIPLFQEYQHSAVYAKIQASRFVGRISFSMDELPPQYEALKVPRLILQPLLENAFEYGMSQKIRDGIVRMSFLPMEERLKVVVEDNGEAFTEELLSSLQQNLSALWENRYEGETTGLLNIAKRLQLYYDQKDVLKVSRSPLGGMQIELLLG